MKRTFEVEAQTVSSEADAVKLAAKLLHEFGIPHKIWQRGDFVEEWWKQSGNSRNDEMPDDVWEDITASYYYRHLSDCTESDWYLVLEAVHSALVGDT